MIVLTKEILQQISYCQELAETSRKFSDTLNSITDQLDNGSSECLLCLLDLLIYQQTITSLFIEYDETYQKALLDLAHMVIREFSTGAGDSSPMPSEK